MDKRELAAPCGLYCGSCLLYMAGSDQTLAAKISDANQIPLEAAVCSGCRAEEGCIKIMGLPVCPTYDCVISKRGLEFCYQCDEFPCGKLAPCADRAKELPHNMKVFNLVLIQKIGLDNWLDRAGEIGKNYFRGKKPRGGDDIQI